MKNFFPFSLFCVSQAFLFLWMRKAPSFGHVKIFFAMIEAVLCGIVGFLYMHSRPKKVEGRIPLSVKNSVSRPPSVVPSEIRNAFELEKKDLLARLESISAETMSLRSLLQLEVEKNEQLQKRIQELGAKDLQFCSHKKLYSQALCEMTVELQKMCTQIELDRKTHAIEIRALLGKDEKRLSSSKMALGGSPGIVPSSIAPIAAVLLILLQCQKGVEKSGDFSWPDPEHRDLVRRAFFDRLQQASHTPLAVFSLERPTEIYVSQKFPQSLSLKECAHLTEVYGSHFRQLSSFEPFQIDSEQLLGSYVAFRLAWKNLEDIIVMVPF